MKPPGHTCPMIDAAESSMRRLTWRVRNPDHTSETTVEDILKEGIDALERVREENRWMRDAYWKMKEERDRALGMLS